MEQDLKIDVALLDAAHRHALEDLVGHQLAANQQLIISVIDVAGETAQPPPPPQTLDDWTTVYEGLNEDEIEAIDEIAKTRADLTRFSP